jgi:Ca-activated chloride channel family protein
MRIRNALFALVAGVGAVAATQLVDDTTVRADTTRGNIQGVVKDKETGEPLAGVTVVVTSSAMKGTQTAITDENGLYKITGLPPGVYLVTFYYLEVTIERSNVSVGASKTTPVFVKIDTKKSGGEVIKISDSAPTIDPTSTTQGITIDRNYIKNIPVPGRTFHSTLGAAGGAGGGQGISFSGSTSVNRTDVAKNTESYSRIDDNPFDRVSAQPLSTFSIDVDTASYANTRRFLHDGALPPKDAVRIEELVNYFHYDYPAPAGTAPVSITTEVGPSPWNPAFKLVRIGLASKDIPDAFVPPRNLTFLLDVSGSMDEENKLPLLVQAMGLLVDHLRPQDRIAIVVYASGTGVVLSSTPGDHKIEIRQALAGLQAGGSTNGAAGVQLAYKQARDNFIERGINRVILCTDGDWNVGTTSEGELTRLIEDERSHDVFLTVLGFGMGNVKDSMMEKLADKGNGNYAYIDTIDEARKVLVKEAGATLVTVAKDVKIQVEMNPATVAGYRLIGYEDRLLAAQDFNDDKKDAGELGAGHAVTALYEVVPAGMPVPTGKVDALKYQTPSAPTGAAATELMTVKVRYKPPTGDTSKLMSQVIQNASPALDKTSIDFRWAAAVAGYGMLLHASPVRGTLTWLQVRSLAAGALGADKEGYRKELLGLIDAASKLKRP